MAQNFKKPTIRLSDKAVFKLKVIAAKNCRNLSNEVRMVLNNHIDQYEDKQGVIRAKHFISLFMNDETLETYSVIRNGSCSHTIKAISPSNKTLNTFIDEDIQVGDFVKSLRTGKEMLVQKLELLSVDNENVCKIVFCE